MKVKVGKRRGRPAKPPADSEKIEAIASLGLIDSEIAVILGISERTLNYWKKDPEFLQSIKRGKTKADAKVTQSLYRSATGYEYVDKNGQKVEVPPNITAIIFWLKNRRPDLWRDKQQQEHSGRVEAILRFAYGNGNGHA